MSQLASSTNPTLRDYFDKTNLGQLLERLVVDLGEERPADVLAYIEKWAATQRANTKGGRRKSAAANGDANGAVEAAREAWRAVGAAKAGESVASHFFDVLFTQHASLRRKLFSGVDVDVAKAGLAPLLSQAVLGDLKAEAIGALAKTHGAARGAEQKHFHYFLTAALTAASIVVGAADFAGSVADGFRIIFTSIADGLMVGLGLKASSGDHTAQAADGTGVSLRDEWDGVADKAAVVQQMLAMLVTQHPSMKKSVLADVDVDVLTAAIVDGIAALLSGSLPDDALVILGTTHGAGRGVEPRHLTYLLSASLCAIQQAVGKAAFAKSSAQWQAKITHAADLLRIGACPNDSGKAGSAGAELQLVGPGVGAAASTVIDAKEAMSALADRPAFDVALESWTAVTDKTQIVTRFYAVLLTQHRSLCNSVLKDLDLEALAPTVAELITALLTGDRPMSDLAAIGAAHGKPRGAQLKHLHYALSAALTALSITIGDTFPAVADHWKTVLTAFVDEFASGATVDGGGSMQEQMSLSMAPVQPPTSAADKEKAEDAADAKERVYTDEECLTLTRGSWAAIGAAGKRKDVAEHFFSVLLTQHPTVKRRLFSGLDTDALVPLLEAQLTAAIEAASFPSLPAITAVAKEHGSPRGPLEMRHYHYFLSAMLAAVAIVAGRKDFAAVAEPWRRVLTQIMQAIMAGAPAVDAEQPPHQ